MGAGRMNERHQRAFGTWAWDLVDQAHPARLELLQRVGEMLHAERDVVQPRPALADEPGYWRIVRGGLEELQRRVTDPHERRAHTLGRDLLGRVDLQTERIPIERERLGEVGHGDADVVKDGFHDGPPRLYHTVLTVPGAAAAAIGALDALP